MAAPAAASPLGPCDSDQRLMPDSPQQAQQAQQALVQDVRDEMMVELLAVLQGAAGACAKVCLSRLAALQEQLLADHAQERRHLEAEADRLARLRRAPAPLPEQGPDQGGAWRGAWEPLEDRGSDALLAWRRAASSSSADKGLKRFDLSSGDSSGGEDWQDDGAQPLEVRRSSLEERYDFLTTIARGMQAQAGVAPPRVGGSAPGRLQAPCSWVPVRQLVPGGHPEAAAAETLAQRGAAAPDAAGPHVAASASFAEFGRGVLPLRLSPKPVEEGGSQLPRRLAAVWHFWQNAENAPPAKGQREARRSSDLTLDEFLSEGTR